MKFNKKTGLVAIASLALVAGGTASVLDFFGESTGDIDAEQAIQIDGQEGEFSDDLGTISPVGGNDYANSNFVENHQSYPITVTVDDTKDAGSNNGLSTKVYGASTIELGSADTSVDVVGSGQNEVTGFHMTGEHTTQGESHVGGVIYDVDATAFEGVSQSEVTDATVAPTFVEHSGHEFQSPDWVGVTFEDSDGEEFTYLTVTADTTSGSDVDIDGSGAYTVLDSEGNELGDASYDETPSSVSEVANGDLDVTGVKLATGTSTIEDNNGDGNVDSGDETRMNITYADAELSIDGSTKSFDGSNALDGSTVELDVPPTEQNEGDSYELGLGVETQEDLDGSTNYDVASQIALK